MERLDRNLDQLVKLHGTFPLETISLVAEQVFSSFATLHGIGFLHRDIKPENIMTSRGSHAIKLIDFGLAERVGSRRTKALIGNVRYSSRQAHLGFSSKKGDL